MYEDAELAILAESLEIDVGKNIVQAGSGAPFRSWPYPRDRLERLAFSAGVDDEALGARLRAESR